MKKYIDLLKETFQEWSEDKAPRLAAALAYYTTFSLAPLLVVAVAVAGLAFGQEAARGEIVRAIEDLVGTESANAIEQMIVNASQPRDSILATILGVVALIFGASGVFGQLQDALDTIWEVQPKPKRGILRLIKDRFFSFTMVLGTGFLLLVSLVLSAAVSALGEYFTNLLPGAEIIWQILLFLLSFAVTTVIFAILYKILPDARVQWRDVWVGALFTAFLFEIGRFLIGLYLGKSSISSSYGAAGSLAVILVWIYYSSQILFLGAEFTQVYAKRYGSRILPDEDAIAVTEEMRSEQGIPHKEALPKNQPRPVGYSPAFSARSSPQPAESEPEPVWAPYLPAQYSFQKESNPAQRWAPLVGGFALLGGVIAAGLLWTRNRKHY